MKNEEKLQAKIGVYQNEVAVLRDQLIDARIEIELLQSKVKELTPEEGE